MSSIAAPILRLLNNRRNQADPSQVGELGETRGIFLLDGREEHPSDTDVSSSSFCTPTSTVIATYFHALPVKMFVTS